MNVSRNPRTLQYASYGFDASLDEILIPLVAGGSVVVPPVERIQDDIAAVIREWHVNFAFLTPTVARFMSPADVAGSLRSLVLLGEQMTAEIVDAWRDAVTLFNGYGPSECSIAATIQRHSSADADLDANNVGRPYGCRIWITDVDDHRRLLPFGCVGQICIEGPIVARGYFGDAGKSNDVFVEDDCPWVDDGNVGRLYKTGDLGILNPDGSFTILGRMDTQAKLRGQRLELGGIENQIRATEEVSQSSDVVVEVVRVGKKGPTGSFDMLAAFVCLKNRRKMDGTTKKAPLLLACSDDFASSMRRLQKHLRDVLVEYMVPTLYVPVSHFPVNSNGKTDRKGLRHLVADLSLSELAPYLLRESRPKEPPRTGKEFKLRQLWSRVLAIPEEDIGLEDDWFKLGGHSVNAVQLASLARSDGELSLSVRSIFRHPKLKDMVLAESSPIHASSKQDKTREPPIAFSLLPSGMAVAAKAAAVRHCVGISLEMVQDVLPCSPIQEAMLATSLDKPASYTNMFAFRIPADVQVDRLRTACQALVAAHEILRTRIFLLNDSPVQAVVCPEAAFTWSQVEARSLHDVLARQRSDADVLGVPLFRFLEVRSEDGDFFCWVIHHALYDGRSMSIMLRQLESAYNGGSLDPSLKFSEYISWCRRQGGSGDDKDDSSSSQQFWKSYLEGSKMSRFPLAGKGEPESNNTLYRSSSLPQRDAHFSGVTHATVLRAAWGLALSAYNSSLDVCWGMTLSGRDGNLDGLADMVAPTLATVPVRVVFSPEEPVEEFLSRIQREAGNMMGFENQGVYRIGKMSTDAMTACRFNTRQVITTQAESTDEPPLGMTPVPETDLGTERVNHMDSALVLECTVTPSAEVHLSLTYDDRLLSTGEAEHLMHTFEFVARQLGESSTETVGDLEFVPPHLRVPEVRHALCDYEVRGPKTAHWDTVWGGLSTTATSFVIASPGKRKQSLPQSAVGELCILGGRKGTKVEGLTPVENASWAAAEPCFATGYLARVTGGRRLHVLGLADNRRDVDGHLLVLEEVEDAVRKHLPGTTKVTAEVVPESKSGQGNPILVAFVGQVTHGGDDHDKARGLVLKAREDMLLGRIPQRLVPSAFVLLDGSSYQSDRRKLLELTESLPRSSFLGLPNNDAVIPPGRVLNKAEHLLAGVWAEVLGVEPDRIRSSSTFMGLGGDSITAMRMMAHLQRKGFRLAMRDIMRRRPLSALAVLMQKDTAATAVIQRDWEKDASKVVQIEAPLSPMQKLFFRLSPSGCNHFNQSLVLRLPKDVGVPKLRQVLDCLVARHDSLRARFRRGEARGWRQEILTRAPPVDVAVSEVVAGKDSVQRELARIQQGLDIQNGLVFAAHVLEMPRGESVLFLVAHHLVIDLVSWRVIVDDLQMLLAGESLTHTASLPWGPWCSTQALQLSTAQLDGNEALLQRHEARVVEALRFWGMRYNPNVFADVETNSCAVDKALTNVFLDAANRALRTEPVEILAASLMASFLDVFHERHEATVFLEDHGRDMFPEADVTQTVGWFTTIYPLRLDDAAVGSFTDCLRRLKDDRRRNSRAAMLGLARSLLSENSDPAEGGGFAMPMEVLLNYGGTVTSIKQTGSLSGVTDLTTDFSLDDVSPRMARMGLIEISAVVEGDELRLSMQHNRLMNHRRRIEHWFRAWINMLEMQLRMLASLEESITLADVPLLSLDYDDLSRLELIELPAHGLSVADIEDIYPCSALQQGILMSQNKDVGDYMTRVVWEVHGIVQPEDLERAWLTVVHRHDSLRTVFLDSPPYTQAVLKTTRPEIRHCRLQGDDSFTKENLLTLAPSALDSECRGAAPPHCLSIITTSGVMGRRRVGLVLTISHAVTDGDSMDVLFRDLELACADRLPGGPGPSYKDFIALHLERREASAEYWTACLRSAAPCLFPGRRELDNDSPTARPLKTHGHAVADLDFSAALHDFCRRSAVTLSDVVHTAWAAVLRVYTGCETSIFGYLYSGRGGDLAGVEDAVGAYVAMLVSQVPLDDDGDLTLQVAAQRAHDASIQALQYAHYSLASIQHELGVGALFNTGISVRRTTTAERRSETPVSLELMGFKDTTEYDIAITVAVDGDGGGVSVSLTHQAEAVARFQAENALALLARALEIITREPLERVRPFVARLAREASGAADNWQDVVPKPTTHSVASLFAYKADATPNLPAVHAWDGSLTYAELRSVCANVAAQLVSRRVRPGDKVPVCFEKSLWYVVAVVGVLMSGAAFLPLDAALPQAAMDHILRSVSADMAITSPRHEARVHARLAGKGGTVIVLPDVLREKHETPPPPLAPSTRDIDLDFTAYVIFTSGSTGSPKGVAVSHGAIASSCAARRGPMGFGPDSRVLQFASSAFDVSVDEIVLTLISGGCVCVPSEEARRDDLAGAMAAMSVNTAMLTPSVAQLLLHPSVDAIPNLRHLILGGERVSRRDIVAWSDRVARLDDIIYGPTECAVASVLLPFVNGLEAVGCLGKPVGCAVWLVDPSDNHRLVPDGCTGEILIEGPILASGYLCDPALTASAFVSGLGWAVDGSRRFFRTGDLAWRDGRGVLHFEGRRDHQMKLRGMRIEAEDIEGHIMRSWPQPGCRAFVDVVSRQDASGGGLGDMLVALVDDFSDKSDSETPETLLTRHATEHFRQAAEETRRRLVDMISAYMVPTLFIPINHMPLSVSGKTDRKQLKKLLQTLSPAEMRAHLDTRHLPGRESVDDGVETETVGYLKAMWARVLGSDGNDIGLDSDFFQIGGDSMTALRLSSCLRADAFHLSVSAIFKTPMLRDMAKAMTRWESPEKAGPEDEPGTETSASLLDARFEHVFPTTEFQSWCVKCSLADPRAYMTYFTVDVLGPLDRARLRTAVDQVVAHLPTLRTVFLSRDENIFQAALRHACLLMRLSHTQYDASSFSAILETLRCAYSGAPLPINSSLKHHVIGETKRVRGRRAREYWRSLLVDCKPTRVLRARSSRAASYPDRLFTCTIPLPPTAPSRTSMSAGFTTATLHNASWAHVLARLSASSDVLFGLVISGCVGATLPPVAGPVMNYVPVRVRLQPGSTAADVLVAVQRQFADGLPFHCGPVFGSDEDMEVRRDVFSSVLQFQSAEVEAVVAGDVALNDDVVVRGARAIRNEAFLGCADVFVYAEVQKGSLRVSFSYPGRVVPTDTVKRMAKEFDHAFGLMVAESRRCEPFSDVTSSDPILPCDALQVELVGTPLF